MVFLIIKENGQKKIVPLTAGAGAGNPVGTVIIVCSNQIPSNYLPLGTQFDTSLYPVLYALLETDTTPTASALGLPTLSSGQYAIKATSGLSENAQDNVINTLNEQRSYSTTEHLTGRKWIDGKPTYEKTIDCGNLPNNTIKSLQNVLADVDTFIKLRGFAMSNNTNIPLPYIDISGGVTYLANVYLAGKTNLNINTNYNFSSYKGTVTVEYTKTTD